MASYWILTSQGLLLTRFALTFSFPTKALYLIWCWAPFQLKLKTPVCRAGIWGTEDSASRLVNQNRFSNLLNILWTWRMFADYTVCYIDFLQFSWPLLSNISLICHMQLEYFLSCYILSRKDKDNKNICSLSVFHLWQCLLISISSEIE